MPISTDPTGAPAGATVQVLRPGTDTATLVIRARAGDRWAAEALYRAHAADVVRVATLLLGRGADVDDVLQDAFVRALGRLETLREPARFGAWVARIAANFARSRLRRRRLLRRFGLDRGEEAVALDELAVEGTSPETRAELARIGRVEGWELTEVAETVGVSLATVKRRIAAIDALLGTDLTATEEGGPR
jgi:RNA polymerase sigma-70 factor (ECF subfamily)